MVKSYLHDKLVLTGVIDNVQVSEFQMPDRRFNKKKPLTGYAWKTIKDHGPGFN